MLLGKDPGVKVRGENGEMIKETIEQKVDKILNSRYKIKKKFNKKNLFRIVQISIIMIFCLNILLPFLFNQGPVQAAVFGQTGTGGTIRTLAGRMEGSVFTCPEECTVTGVSVYLQSRDQSNDWFVVIYESDGSTNITDGISQERSIYDDSWGWKEFTFSTNPELINTDYLFVVASDHNADSRVMREIGDTDNAYYQSYSYNYPTVPEPHNMNQMATRGDYSIFITYTAGWSNTAPTIEQESPANQSTAQSRWPTLSVRVNDSDGNNSKAYFYTNSTVGGQWTLLQTNSSVLNETVRLMNFTNASSYLTKYFWRVSANDTHDNTTKTFHFTTESETYVNSAPTFASPSPSNGSSGQPRWATLQVTINDADNNDTEVDWYFKDGAVWYKLQHNSSVSAGSIVRLMNLSNASAYSTEYWWKVTANDTHDNSSVAYRFTTQSDPGVEPGTDYYVSNTGNDANAGTSTGTPWRTMTKVNGELVNGTIASGDNVYFNRDDSWTGTMLEPRTGGTSDNYMVFGAYGTGEKPLISCSTDDGGIKPHGSLTGGGYIRIENLNVSNCAPDNGLNWRDLGECYELHVINCDFINNNYGIRLDDLDGYRIENCFVKTSTMSLILIHGQPDYHIQNGRIWNCTLKDANRDGLSFHYYVGGGGDLELNYVGSRHWVKNCTISEVEEAGIDVSFGKNPDGGIYVEDVEIFDCVGGVISGIAAGHNQRNETYHNIYMHDNNGDHMGFTNDKFGILRYSTLESSNDEETIINQNSPNYQVENLAIYHNTIIADTGGGYMVQVVRDESGGVTDDLAFKNNIYYSKAGTPGYLVWYAGHDDPDLTDTNSEWTNDMWYHEDGLTGNHWFEEGPAANMNWAQWTSQPEVSGNLRDDPEFVDMIGDNFLLNDTSPCIDAGDWLTETNGDDSGIWIVVDNANYFMDGYGITGLSGDNIFVGATTNLEIIDVNYYNNTIKVNRSITWSDGDPVSLSSYNGTAPDIGRYEFGDNSNPTFSNPQPSNGATGIYLSPSCNITVADPDGDSMNITFASDFSGSWLNYQTNASQPNGTYRWVFTNANQWGTEYNWRVYLHDGEVNLSNDYSFTTLVNNSPVITGERPLNTSGDVSASPTCNVTVTDAESDTMNVYFYNSTDGSIWTLNQTNGSVASGANVSFKYTQATSDGVTYHWMVAVNDSINNVTAKYHFIVSGIPPNLNATTSGLFPANETIKVAQMLTINITVNDPNGDDLNVYWIENSTGSWITRQSNLTVTANTSVDWEFLQANGSNKKYFYRVCVRDEENWTNATYWIRTSPRIFDVLHVDNFIKYANNPVVNFSLTGWESYGLNDIALLVNDTGHIEEDSGNIVMYYSGRRIQAGIKNTSVGRVNGTNETSWIRYPGNPVFINLTAYLANHEAYAQVGSVIDIIGDGIECYYASDIGKNSSMKNSTDGLTWYDQGKEYDPLTNSTNPNNIWSPYVTYSPYDSMWYKVYSAVVDGEHNIFALNSTDRVTWDELNGGNPIYTGINTWDINGTYSPKLYPIADGMYVIIYSGFNSTTNQYKLSILLSRYIDNSWISWENNPILTVGSGGSWDDARLANGIIPMDDINERILRMWYAGLPTTKLFKDGAIGYATCVDIYYPYPWQSNPGPENESIDQSIRPVLNITVTDYQGDEIDIYIRTNASGSWQTIEGFTGATNGSYSANATSMNSFSTQYWWSVNVSNGSGFWENITYTLTTEEPGIAPVVSNLNPINGATGVSLSQNTISFNLNDQDGHPMNYTATTSPDIGSGSDTNVNNGSYNFAISGLFYSTTYYWDLNVSDGYLWTNATYSFTTTSAPGGGNAQPSFSSPSPTNGATKTSLTPLCAITVTDLDDDSMTVTFASDFSGSWLNYQTNSSVSSGSTVRWNHSGATSYNTAYNWRVYANDETDNVSVTYGFTTIAREPVQSNPSPSNSSTDISLTPTCVITVSDPNGDSITITFGSNFSGSWLNYQTNSSPNGTYRWVFTNADSYGTKYFWRVYVYDEQTNVSATYQFTTLANPIPQIINENPYHKRRKVSITITNLSVDISDDSGTFNFSIGTLQSIGSYSKTDVADGTKVCNISGLQNDVKYTWWVNATDGLNYDNQSFTFWTKKEYDFDTVTYEANFIGWHIGGFERYLGLYVMPILFGIIIVFVHFYLKNLAATVFMIFLTFALYGSTNAFIQASELSLIFAILAAIGIAGSILALFMKRRHG